MKWIKNKCDREGGISLDHNVVWIDDKGEPVYNQTKYAEPDDYWWSLSKQCTCTLSKTKQETRLRCFRHNPCQPLTFNLLESHCYYHIRSMTTQHLRTVIVRPFLLSFSFCKILLCGLIKSFLRTLFKKCEV